MRPRIAMVSGVASASGELPGVHWLSRILFLATFLFFWISIDPYVDLGNPSVLLPQENASFAKQILLSLLTLGVLWRAATVNPGLVRVLFLWPAILVFAWFAVTVMTSPDLALSARRYVLTLMVFATAAGLLILPRDTADFAALLATAAVLVLALSYGGVVLAPDYSIHQATDLIEPEHAGHWRGPFDHKNTAGSAMVLLVFAGLYVARTGNRMLGWAIVLASAVFLVCSQAKTSIQMIVPILVLAWLVDSARSLVARAALIWGGLAVLSLMTVGSVVFAPIRALLASLVSDPTFTGRTVIWSFVLGKIQEHPWLGHGYDAFWGSNAVFFGESQTWANTVPHSHNCYLDLALNTGWPGLILVLLYVVVRPTIDFHRSTRTGNERATTLFFLRTWLFCIYFGSMESFMFRNGGAIWFMMVLAMLGLRLSAGAIQVVARPRPTSPVLGGLPA